MRSPYRRFHTATFPITGLAFILNRLPPADFNFIHLHFHKKSQLCGFASIPIWYNIPIQIIGRIRTPQRPYYGGMVMENRLNIQSANGIDVLDWFSSGASEVAAHIRYLNLINVFPVADGDTGTNMATTMRAMVETPARDPYFSQMLQRLSQALGRTRNMPYYPCTT